MKQSANFIHIDEVLAPSLLKWLVWCGALVLILAMIGLLSLPISYRVLLGILAVLCVGLSHMLTPQLIAISTIDIHPLALIEQLKNADIELAEPLRLNHIEWQLAIKTTPFTHSPSQLWQGYLLDSIDTGSMLILNFCITSPQPQQFKLTIWQDQCTPDTWRQLKTISHLIHH